VAVTAEALVREGVPFREAHERIAAKVREGSFQHATTLTLRDRGIDVRAAVRAARERWR
jgi:argininosuccinate lyase